jgi:peptidoglycan/LPS O-acetylase OafA/YrhL
MNNIRKDVQYLRAVSVVAVVLFHSFPGVFSAGYLGVDLFFFISGWLIFPQIFELMENNSKFELNYQIKHFIRRRIYRIAPALGICILFTWILFFFFGPSPANFAGPEFSLSIFSIFGLSNLAAFNFSGDYFNSKSPLTHLWSLGVEIQIYFLMAFLAYLFAHKIRSSIKNFRFLLLLIILISILSRYIFLIHAHLFGYLGLDTLAITGEFADFYFSSNRVWEFAVGGLASTFQLNNVGKIAKRYRSFYLIFIFLLLSLPLELNVNLKLIAIFVLTIVYLMANDSVKINFFSKVFLWVGDRSYSIYLYHLPIIFILGNNSIPKKYSFIFYIVAIILIIIVGNLSYNFVETKFVYIRKNSEQNSSFYLNHKKLLWSSYIMPLFLIVIIINFNQKIPVENDIKLNFTDNYAASDLSRCPLGQIENECVLIEATSKNHWLLLGDSHAGAIQEVIAQIAAKNDASLAVWNKCRFFDPSIDSTLNSLFPEWCVKSNIQRIKYIHEVKPKLVLVSYQNVDVAYGSTKLDPQLWQEVFLKTLKSIKDEGVNLILFSQIPEYPNSPSEKYRFGFEPEKSIDINNFTDLINEKKFEEKIRNSHIDVIDLTNLLCDSKSCMRFKGNWLYIDTNHLSNFGAEFLKFDIESQLAKYNI